jgi:hypothetical protein
MFVNLFKTTDNMFCMNNNCKKLNKCVRHLQHYKNQQCSGGIVVHPDEKHCTLYIKGVKK